MHGNWHSDLELLEKHFARLLRTCRESEVSACPTPFTLFDTDHIQANCLALREAASGRRFRMRIHFATKALYVDFLLNDIDAYVDGFDVQSTRELRLVPARSPVAFHSPALPSEVLTSPRVTRVSLNSLGQCAAASQHFNAPSKQWGFRTSLRVIAEGQFVTSRSKFGMPPREIAAMLQSRLPSEAKARCFIHHHSHARLHDMEEAETSAATFAAMVQEIQNLSGHSVTAIDIGGGWDGGFEATLKGSSPAVLLARQLELLERMLPEIEEVVIEPGRALVEDACVAVARVLDVQHAEGTLFVVVDMATNFLIPLDLARFRFIPLNHRKTSDAPREVCVVDGTCSPRGRIATQVIAHDFHPGERIAIFNCGAYTYSLASTFYSDPPTAYVLDRNGGVRRLEKGGQPTAL